MLSVLLTELLVFACLTIRGTAQLAVTTMLSVDRASCTESLIAVTATKMSSSVATLLQTTSLGLQASLEASTITSVSDSKSSTLPELIVPRADDDTVCARVRLPNS